VEYRKTIMVDYYKTLGIDKNAGPDEIKKAFRKQAKKHHPDANPDNPQAEQRFKEINEAYEVLSDPEKRRQYDTFGANWQQYQQGGFGGNGNAYTQTNVNVEDLSDLFDSIFGGAGGRSSRRSGGFSNFGFNQDAVRQRGQNIEQPVTISLQEAYHGAQRIITKEGRQMTVKIPAGAKDGTKVRLKSEGAPGAYGGEAGDLFLVVNVADDPRFTRENDDLHVDVQIDMFTALLGGTVEIPTMDRPLKLKIPAGTQSGNKFRLAGKGMPIIRKKGQHGDLYAHIQITVPKNLTEQQKQLVQQLQRSLEV